MKKITLYLSVLLPLQLLAIGTFPEKLRSPGKLIEKTKVQFKISFLTVENCQSSKERFLGCMSALNFAKNAVYEEFGAESMQFYLNITEGMLIWEKRAENLDEYQVLKQQEKQLSSEDLPYIENHIDFNPQFVSAYSEPEALIEGMFQRYLKYARVE